MKFTSKSTTSLKNLFVVIITFAMASIVINIQSVRYTAIGGSDLIPLPQNEIARQIVAGSDVRGFGRSLNQHPDFQSKEPEPDVKQTLLLKLMQIEERLRKHVTSPAVALIGSHGNEEFITSVTLKDHKLHVVRTGGTNTMKQLLRPNDVRWHENRALAQGNWSVMFCADLNECPADHIEISRKADVIPELREFVDNPSRLCDIARIVHRSEANKPCCESGVHVEISETSEVQWRVEYENGTRTYLRKDGGCGNEETGQVHWRLPSSPVIYEAGPLLRLRCLVTSWLPLRFYVSSLVQTGPYAYLHDETNFIQTSVGDTLQYISESYGLGTSSHWWTAVQGTVVKYLVQMESSSDATARRCRRCFQLLHLDLVCHSIGQCNIIKVTDDRRLSSEYINSVFPVISMTSLVASDVSRALETISPYSPLELCENGVVSSGCLTEDDLIYIIDDRSETINMADWIKVYPSAEGHVINPSAHAQTSNSWLLSNTYHAHSIFTELQKYYKRRNQQNHEFSDRDSMEAYWKYEDLERSSPDKSKDGGYNRICSSENNAYGKITTISTDPVLTMDELSPGQFYANVSYSTIMVKLWTSAAHCNCDVRLENKYNTPGPKNIILGLGETRVRIYVVDKDLPEPSVVNVIAVTIHREPRGVKDARTFTAEKMVACGLKQECSLRFDRNEICGLQDLDMTWSTYKSLPFQHCNGGDAQARWIVPCTACNDERTCNWRHSRWQPNTCSYRRLSTHSVKQCLAGKKILFIGDSTNRGILNYIIDRINGSLWDWDKTHTIKVYSSVNSNSSFLSFAYYPHFWLPADHRPKFHKVIYQLVKSSLPLENNSNTVLVVGGVQWLARQHIDYIIEALQKKGLSNITKVVKGIGAGFHQPVEGVRFLPQSEHATLAQKEQEILSYSKDRAFKVVSTFNMTMSRYMDFLEGKCACHFHKVTKSYPDDQNGNAERGQYSVTGEINAAYSDIVIDQICS